MQSAPGLQNSCCVSSAACLQHGSAPAAASCSAQGPVMVLSTREVQEVCRHLRMCCIDTFDRLHVGWGGGHTPHV
jgi:hypothetical protein